MNKRRVEAIAEAIARHSGYYDPETSAYYARNPGALKAFSPSHLKNEEGLRVFTSVLDGMQALIFDVEVKITGKSQAHLTPDNTLIHLALAYNLSPTAAKPWVKFIKHALRDETINTWTPLSYFIEEKE
jgi:hypothetical protein